MHELAGAYATEQRFYGGGEMIIRSGGSSSTHLRRGCNARNECRCGRGTGCWIRTLLGYVADATTCMPGICRPTQHRLEPAVRRARPLALATRTRCQSAIVTGGIRLTGMIRSRSPDELRLGALSAL